MFAPAYPLVSGPFLVVSLRGPRLGRFAFPVLGFSASPRACRVCSGLCTSSSPVPRFRFRLRAAPSPCVPVLRTLYSVFKDLLVCLPTAFHYFYYTYLISNCQALFLSQCDCLQRNSEMFCWFSEVCSPCLSLHFMRFSLANTYTSHRTLKTPQIRSNQHEFFSK